MYNEPLPNAVFLAGVVLMVVAFCLLIAARADGAAKLSRAMWGWSLLVAGVTFVLGAMWLDGSVWFPGRVLGAVLWVVCVIVFVRVIVRIRRRAHFEAAHRSEPLE